MSQLDKLSKILNQAENASTPEEAATFMAKAQEMAAINGMDLAVARLHQANKEKVQEPEERTLVINQHTRRFHRKHFLDLAMAIADVNDVKYLIGADRLLFVVGFPSDIDVVEALYTHLAVQMAMEADEALARGDNKMVAKVAITEKAEIAWEDREWGQWNGRQYYDDDPFDNEYQRHNETTEEFRARVAAEYLAAVKNKERVYSHIANGGYGGYRLPVPPPAFFEVTICDEDGNPTYEEKTVSRVDGRVFRGDFYEGFISRMKGRLWEIKHSVEKEKLKDDLSDSTALALRDKKAEVNKAHEAQRNAVVKWSSSGYESASESERKRDYSGYSQRKGRDSAERVPIDNRREVKRS